MHELGVVFKVMETVERVAAEHKVTEVSCVCLRIGEVSGIIDSYLQNCWKWAIKKSELLKTAELKMETIPAITYCEACGRTYPTVQYAKICPHCGSDRTYLQQGNEFEVKEIVISDKE